MRVLKAWGGVVRENSKGAWFGDAELKAEVLARMIEHRERDEIIHGVYQELDPDMASGYKGCLIGCTLPKQPPFRDADGQQRDIREPQTPGAGWHGEVERLYGISEDVAKILDESFEGLAWDLGADFAVESIEAIQSGADLSGVWQLWWESDESAAASEVLQWLRDAPLVVPGE